MRRGAVYGLLTAILVAGAAVRLLPLTRWALWGSDSGEYYFLTNQLLATGEIRFAYEGWGLAYPYFPGMFLVNGAVSAMTGLDTLTTLRFVVPILAGVLLPLGLFLITSRITGDDRVALVAAGILALTGASAIVTNHPMPGTVGHIFLIAALVALLWAYEDRRARWPLAVAGAALLLTHHLTMYFLVGTVMCIALARELLQERTSRAETRVETGLLLGLLTGVGVWWLVVAVPFREEIVGDLAEGVNPWLIASLCYVLALVVPLTVLARRRLLPGVRWEPTLPRWGVLLGLVAAGLLIPWSVALAVAAFGVPGTTIHVGGATLLYLIPVSLWMMFTAVGVVAARGHPRGTFLIGWLAAIVGSAIFSSVTGSRVLFPFRHVEYLVEPLAALCAIGFFAVADRWRDRAPQGAPRARRALAAAVAATLVLAGSALGSNPPRETIGGFEEGMSAAEMEAVQWARDALPKGSHFAADHRISSVLFGFAGMNATWDTAGFAYQDRPFNATEYEQGAFPEGVARIDYVFVSPEIEKGVTLYQWEPSTPMTPGAIAKFRCPPFETVYDRDGVRIYRVDWEAVRSGAPLGCPA